MNVSKFFSFNEILFSDWMREKKKRILSRKKKCFKTNTRFGFLDLDYALVNRLLMTINECSLV